MTSLPELWDRVLSQYRWEITLATIAAIVLGIGVFWWFKPETPPEVQILSAHTSTATASATSLLYVDVSGAVKVPGVYKFEANSRVDDALAAAGGLTSLADTKWLESSLNRAEKIRDGMKIHIPEINEAKVVNSAVNIISAESKINLNSASNAELEALPGIGPVTAQKIIDNRPYTEVRQLLEKKVVGQKVFDQIQEHVVAW